MWLEALLDTLSARERSIRMGLVRSKDTKPELVVRRLVHSLGYRYRLHRKDLPGTPDLVFAKRRKAIFVHGCFWHRHDDAACKLARLPKSRLDFWLPKLQKNKERDLMKENQLISLGWDVLTVWECQVKDLAFLEEKIKRFLG